MSEFDKAGDKSGCGACGTKTFRLPTDGASGKASEGSSEAAIGEPGA